MTYEMTVNIKNQTIFPKSSCSTAEILRPKTSVWRCKCHMQFEDRSWIISAGKYGSSVLYT